MVPRSGVAFGALSARPTVELEKYRSGVEKERTGVERPATRLEDPRQRVKDMGEVWVFVDYRQSVILLGCLLNVHMRKVKKNRHGLGKSKRRPMHG
jgi:hypothetical protein